MQEKNLFLKNEQKMEGQHLKVKQLEGNSIFCHTIKEWSTPKELTTESQIFMLSVTAVYICRTNGSKKTQTNVACDKLGQASLKPA